MTDPITAVRILLAWLLDAQAAPQSHRFGGSGPVPSARVECPGCGGRGFAGRWRAPCPRCGGSVEDVGEGRVVHHPGRGWIVVDDYTGDEVGTAETGTVDRRRRVRCDSCDGWGVYGNGRRCKWCDGSGSRMAPALVEDASPVGGEPDALEVALEASRSTGATGLYRHGDFALVERALGELSRPSLRLVWATYVVSDRLEETDRSRRQLKALAMRVRVLIQLDRDQRRLRGLPDRPADIRVPAECLAWWRDLAA